MEEAVYAIVGVFALLIIWIGYATINPIAGVWRREGEGEGEDEYILFEQVGPFVTGKRNVDGGNHVYSGLQTFNTLRLTRRDFGLPALIAQGFPAVIARKLNGTVVARMTLVRRGKKVLSGTFSPQKILFDEPSAKVLSRQYTPPMQRVFAKTDMVVAPQTKGAGVRPAALPPPVKTKKPKGNTF